MKTEEAASIIEERVRVTEYVESGYVDCVDIEALRIAIKALEKQIPKKPTTRIDDYYENLYRMYCPTCGNSIGRGNKRVGYVVRQYEGQKCCGVCGQQIEWPKQWL